MKERLTRLTETIRRTNRSIKVYAYMSTIGYRVVSMSLMRLLHA